jgi:hypothetical protein
MSFKNGKRPGQGAPTSSITAAEANRPPPRAQRAFKYHFEEIEPVLRAVYEIQVAIELIIEDMKAARNRSPARSPRFSGRIVPEQRTGATVSAAAPEI